MSTCKWRNTIDLGSNMNNEMSFKIASHIPDCHAYLTIDTCFDKLTASDQLCRKCALYINCISYKIYDTKFRCGCLEAFGHIRSIPTYRVPFHWRFFHRDASSMEISFWFHIKSNKVIAIRFCSWHDRCAVVACATFCGDLMASNWIKAKQNFYQIWTKSKTTFSEIDAMVPISWNVNPFFSTTSHQIFLSQWDVFFFTTW